MDIFNLQKFQFNEANDTFDNLKLEESFPEESIPLVRKISCQSDETGTDIFDDLQYNDVFY